MDHKFEADTFACIDIAGNPSVQEIQAGTYIATTHPWTQHDTLDDAIAAAQGIKSDYAHGGSLDPNTGKTVHGFIAQEMQEVVPEAVSGDPDPE